MRTRDTTVVVVEDDEPCADCAHEADCSCTTCDCANEMHAGTPSSASAGGRSTPPRDDLYRAMPGGVMSEDGRTLTIRLAPHDQWAEIQSVSEGHFMERFSRSAYRKTMSEHPPKIIFQHGKDPQVGEKPISTTDEVGEDSVSPFARGQILDGVPELIVDGLRKGVYGASHRFSVVRESWVEKPVGGAHNPKKIPERTITEARLFELGPVTWPAYAQASASLRSTTDEMRNPPEPVAPSPDAAALPHLGPERRDEPVPIAARTHRETTRMTPEDRAARDREITDELARINSEHTGTLPGDLQDHWDALTAEQDRLRTDQAAYEARMARLEAAARTVVTEPVTPTRAYTPPSVVTRYTQDDIYDTSPLERMAPEQRGQAYRDRALRAAESKRYPGAGMNVDTQRTLDRIGDLVDHADSPEKHIARRILLTGSPVYERAFNKIVSGGQLSPEEQRAAALAVGVDGTGGFSVPFAFDPTIIAIGVHNGAVNPYRSQCRVVSISGTDTWNPVTATAITATRTTEAAAATEQGPTFAQGANGAYIVKRVQAFVTFSYEIGQDRPDLASELGRLIAEAKDNEEEASFATGLGTTTASLGVMPVYGTSNMFTALDTAGSVVLAAADAYAVEAALPVRHRQNAIWIMNRGNLRKFQALETASGILFGKASYGYQFAGIANNDPSGNFGNTLLGYPVFESPSCPTAGTSHINIAVLFNPDQYVIVDRIGMNIEVIPNLFNSSALPTGQRGLYAMWRNHAAPLNVDAGRVLDYKT